VDLQFKLLFAATKVHLIYNNYRYTYCNGYNSDVHIFTEEILCSELSLLIKFFGIHSEYSV